MKDSIAPKAVNIIRPYKQKDEIDRYTLTKPSKIITSAIHSSKQISFNLYDPKKAVPLSKKPTLKKTHHNIEIYDPKKIQLLNRQLIADNIMDQPKLHYTTKQNKPEQLHSPDQQYPNIMPNELKPQKEEQELSTQESTSEEEEDDDDEDEEEETQDILSEARINRKIADLEISNKSLLVINEMLESTVRNQAKQIASLKNQLPEGSNEQEKKKPEEIIQNEEEEWESDEQFDRLVHMTELLIEEAQNAIDHKVQETGGRVITGYHHRRHDGHTDE